MTHLFDIQNEDPERKITDIAQFLAQQIILLCECQFSSSYIADGQLFCTVKDAVIYQAQLYSTDEKTALEIRNTTQLLILSKPILVIDQQLYPVDPYCSVVVKELGTTTCDTISNSQPLVSTIELASVVGTGVILILVIVLTIILVFYCYCKKRSKSFDVR